MTIRNHRKYRNRFVTFLVSLVIVYALINIHILSESSRFIFKDINKLNKSYTAIVLGASVYSDGRPSQVLADRLDVASELYMAGKVQRILLSGDHGQQDYDEVNNMRKYLVEKAIPDSIIFTDHAGFDTYNTMTRAKNIFAVDSAIIITQQFHISRAVFIARSKGLKAYGLIADRHKYPSLYYLKLRESFANIKAYFEVLFNRKPYCDGKKIPIKGLSYPSHDQ